MLPDNTPFPFLEGTERLKPDECLSTTLAAPIYSEFLSHDGHPLGWKEAPVALQPKSPRYLNIGPNVRKMRNMRDKFGYKFMYRIHYFDPYHTNFNSLFVSVAKILPKGTWTCTKNPGVAEAAGVAMVYDVIYQPKKESLS